MKTLLTITIALIGFSFSNAQVRKDIKPAKKKSVVLEARPIVPLSKRIDRVPARKFTYLGSFVVTGYHILSVKTPGSKELEEIDGSIVKVGYNAITGAEIKPMTFGLLGDASMTRTEFIQHVFGRQVRVREPNLPNQFLVHKTDHEVCRGFAELDRDHLAVPYMGVLLYLERR